MRKSSMIHKVTLSALVFLAAFACSPVSKSETVAKYSLCPKSKSARDTLPGLARSFAKAQGATFSDVGPIRERELMSGGGRGVLSETGGPLVVIVVEKKGDFRFSLGNLGLREKFGIGVRVSAEGVEESALAGFFSELSLEWTVQKVDGGITNDPPCDRSLKLSLDTSRVTQGDASL
jgi:hypothetical protein